VSRFAHRGYNVGVFVDNVNLYVGCHDKFGRGPNHALLLKEAVADNILYRAIAYGVKQGNTDRWRAALERFGFEVQEKEPRNGKANWDVDLVVDVWRLIGKLDMVVIVSGDGDFVALVNRCRELGKVVRVISVVDNTSNELIEAADEFVPVGESLLLAKEAKDG
jgi:uncharacterized LabA/DUF88 family protein